MNLDVETVHIPPGHNARDLTDPLAVLHDRPSELARDPVLQGFLGLQTAAFDRPLQHRQVVIQTRPTDEAVQVFYRPQDPRLVPLPGHLTARHCHYPLPSRTSCS